MMVVVVFIVVVVKAYPQKIRIQNHQIQGSKGSEENEKTEA
jgi:hypothetical protein